MGTGTLRKAALRILLKYISLLYVLTFLSMFFYNFKITNTRYFLSEKKIGLVLTGVKPSITSHSFETPRGSMYEMLAIISRGLYIFTPFITAVYIVKSG